MTLLEIEANTNLRLDHGDEAGHLRNPFIAISKTYAVNLAP